MCVLDLSVLRSAVLGDRQYNLGAIVARRLHHNGLHGDLFGGIYATRIAAVLVCLSMKMMNLYPLLIWITMP